jgi:hypothetical protein
MTSPLIGSYLAGFATDFIDAASPCARKRAPAR